MQKRGMLLIACTLFFLLLAMNVHGFEVKYEYSGGISNVSLFIYNCTDADCMSIAESHWNNATFTPESSITISNTTPVANSSLEFHFANCGMRIRNRNLTWYLASAGSTLPISLSQAPSCNSTINITSMPSQINVSQTLTVGINLGPVFKNSSNLPSAVAHFYDANVTVKLLVNESVVNSANVTVPWNGKSLSLSWTPAEAGVYNVTVQSEVSDCKCSSSVVMQDSKLVTVTQPSQPSPQQPQNYMLTIIVKPNSTVGSISKNPDLSSYASGSQVTLTATPSTGFNFSNWQIDGVNSSDNPIVITMSSNKTVYAWFVVAGETGGGGETGGEGGAGNETCGPCNYSGNWTACLWSPELQKFVRVRLREQCVSRGCVNRTELEECNVTVTGNFTVNTTFNSILDAQAACSARGGRLCSLANNETCLARDTIETYAINTTIVKCCRAECKEYCAVEGALQYCLPGNDRCALMRQCVGGVWSECVKIDPSCLRQACEDGTPEGFCSVSRVGFFCKNGSLVANASCTTELALTQLQSAAALQQQLGGQPGQPSQLGLGVKEPLLKRVRNVMLYALIAALIVVAVVGVAVAIGKRRGRIEVGEEMPRVVRPSELLISLMENLSYNERRVCEKLLEGDGIRKSALREELGMTKQQLDKALEALESKQVIKELEEEKDPRVWFRDELLE